MSLNIPQDSKSPFLFVTVKEDGSALILAKEPTPCKDCLSIHYHFINRSGSTRCLDCDEKEAK